MKINSRKKSPTVGEFIASAYGVYFPHDLTDHGGTDADHVPVVPGNDFFPDAGHGDDSTLQPTASSAQLRA